MTLRIVWRDQSELPKTDQFPQLMEDGPFDAVYPVTSPPFLLKCNAIPGEVARIRARILVPPENNW